MKSEIDNLLTALADYCRGGNCAQCKYITKSDTCRVLEKIEISGDFPYPEDIPEEEDDEYEVEEYFR